MASDETQTELEVLDTYNPDNRTADELPFIYGFNNGGGTGEAE